jgi:hypothetical protein
VFTVYDLKSYLWVAIFSHKKGKWERFPNSHQQRTQEKRSQVRLQVRTGRDAKRLPRKKIKAERLDWQLNNPKPFTRLSCHIGRQEKEKNPGNGGFIWPFYQSSMAFLPKFTCFYQDPA